MVVEYKELLMREVRFARVFIAFLVLFLAACNAQNSEVPHESKVVRKDFRLGIQNTGVYIPRLKGKNVAVVANKTSVLEKKHLVDTLLSSGIHVVKVFAPEHGFRGNYDAGAKVEDEVDEQTGLPIISLHGKHKKPTDDDLAGVDVIVFDIQDVGVRFYTYISTLHYVMEAAAENGKKVVILDRPNYHDGYVDGPVLDSNFKSFVGMHPVPVIYGLTIGEYGTMINGEGWLKNNVHCDLEVIAVKGYKRGTYNEQVEISPSPNLPNKQSIQLYPSLCFFEGTIVSVGRGTDYPFQVYGHPNLSGEFNFTPKSRPGFSTYPKFENEVCKGKDLRAVKPKDSLNWSYLIDAYRQLKDHDFFLANHFIDLLAGTDSLRLGLLEGWTKQDIHNFYQEDLEEYKRIREKYLLYP